MRKRSPGTSEKQGPAELLRSSASSREADAAACLVIVGSIGFLPFAGIIWVLSAEILQSAWWTIRWTSVSTFWQTAQLWITNASVAGRVSTTLWIFFAGYCVLLWLWISVLLRGRASTRSSYVWALSTAYFVAVIVVIATIVHSASNSVMAWLMGTLLFSAIPGAFLAVIIPLWLMVSHPKNAPFDTRAGT